MTQGHTASNCQVGISDLGLRTLKPLSLDSGVLTLSAGEERPGALPGPGSDLGHEPLRPLHSPSPILNSAWALPLHPPRQKSLYQRSRTASSSVKVFATAFDIMINCVNSLCKTVMSNAGALCLQGKAFRKGQ